MNIFYEPGDQIDSFKEVQVAELSALTADQKQLLERMVHLAKELNAFDGYTDEGTRLIILASLADDARSAEQRGEFRYAEQGLSGIGMQLNSFKGEATEKALKLYVDSIARDLRTSTPPEQS